ncbi:MAG: hypothetical protein AAGE52_25860 [Myxococcota bacterium]
MQPPRIDVVIPGAEGGWIARTLRSAGYDVREADDLRDSEEADAVIVDRSLPGFDDDIAKVDKPLRIVVGWELPDAEEQEPWKSIAVFRRPLAVPKLFDVLREHLPPPSDPRSRATMPAPTPAESEPESVPPPPIREPTMNLELKDLPPKDKPKDQPPTLDEFPIPKSAVSVIGKRSSNVPPTSSPGLIGVGIVTGTGTTGSSVGYTAELSAHLVEMLREADRRIFPSEAPLDLRFPGGDDPADEIVPDQMLAEVSLPLDVPEADPLEAFTFVGTADLIESTESPIEEGERTPHTVQERGGDSVSSTVHSDLTREGMLPAAGALRVLWQAHDEARATTVQFDVPGGPSMVLTIHRHQVVGFEGPTYLRVAAQLRAEGRLRTSVDDEESATTLLQNEVRVGHLSEYELAARVRRAREDLIGELITMPEARFALRSQPSPSGPRVFAGSLMAVACEQARRTVRAEDALRWLGFERQSKLVLSNTFAARALDAGLEPELVAAFEAAAEGAVGELLSVPPPGAGVAGALFTLAAGDAVRVDGEARDYVINAALVRERLLALHARALEGSYFAILELRREATRREVEEARRRLSRELALMDLAFLGLENLDGLRREALIAIDEASEMLMNDRLRRAYAESLRV